ncbi:MAG: MGMT family protein [Pyrinomonadaceae bacterium MAG19_C2-C3]|nr:MGMT family protein [Pyrinomonadaceae bacterium MAG19_C2-C3]
MSDDNEAKETDAKVRRENRDSPGYRERVFEIVRRIPAGRVMTYGQLAEILGAGYDARTVGYCMHAATEDVTWHRVINAQGACSTGRVILPANKQQSMLEEEGIEFDAKEKCDLARYRWTPPEAEGAETTNDDEQPSLFD